MRVLSSVLTVVSTHLKFISTLKKAVLITRLDIQEHFIQTSKMNFLTLRITDGKKLVTLPALYTYQFKVLSKYFSIKMFQTLNIMALLCFFWALAPAAGLEHKPRRKEKAVPRV